MKTIYINNDDGIPERFDYEKIQIKTSEYNTTTGQYNYIDAINIWHVEGYHYQERTYIGWFNNLQEFKDFSIACEII